MKKRPIVIALYLLTMFFWSALFFHLVPSATGGWIAWSLSIVFGGLTVALLLVAGVLTARRSLRGDMVQS